MLKKKHRKSFLLLVIIITVLCQSVIMTQTSSFVAAAADESAVIRDSHSIYAVKELEDKRTRNSKTYLNSDGTTSVQMEEHSLNYLDGEDWKEIDTTIKSDNTDSNYSHSMLTNNYKVRLNNKKDKEAISFSISDQAITYEAKGMNSVAGVVNGSIITYQNAWQSTDMQYMVENDQLKMELHLANKRAPKSFTFNIGTKNVSYHLNQDGSIDFFNENGEISFQIPRMWVKDAADNEKRYDKLQINLTQQKGQTTLVLTLDDRDLQYPIIIDPTTSLPSAAAGTQHTLWIRKVDGTVWAWGNNNYGQLGDGTTTTNKDDQELINVRGLLDVISVAAGGSHSLAVKQDGSVWAWGANDYSQLGNGTTTNSSKPIQVNNLANMKAVAAGRNHSIGVKQDGTVWVWGDNSNGQMGDGTTSFNSAPVQVSGLSNVIAVEAGNDQSYAIKQDGSVWGWGYSVLSTKVLTPLPVSGLSNVKAVSTKGHHSLALKQDGTVWGWGYNVNGQLGNGTTDSSSTPVQVSGLTNVIAIAAGTTHSLALKQDGTVWAWGSNSFGEFGIGTTTSSSTPILVSGLNKVTEIFAGDGYSTAIRYDGTVWAWGYNHLGQTGNGSTGIRKTPVQLNGMSNIISTTAGASHSLAVKQDGTVWSWGNNEYAQLGDGSYNDHYTPIQVSGITNVKLIAAGRYYSIAVKQDGTVWNWGGSSASIPKQVSGLSNIKAIAAGESHSLAVKEDGTVWSWGGNYDGQLGNGTNVYSSIPAQINGLSTVISAAAGQYHSLVLKQDGTVWAWGNNAAGQLGNDTITNKSYPIKVNGLSNVKSIAAGLNFSLALKQDGTVWAWGDNTNGQLGNGTNIRSLTPVKVIGLSNVVSIVSGGSHSLAVKQDGTICSWGNNSFGQLGNSMTANSSTPVQVSGLRNVTMAAAGDDHSLAINQDGNIQAWGANYYGQVGDGSLYKLFPQKVFGTDPSGINITFAASTLDPTDQPVTITVFVTGNWGGTQLKWASGEQEGSYFLAGGTEIIGNKFTISTNGTYTVWGKDIEGNVGGLILQINNIEPPSAPSDLKSESFDYANVYLSWTSSIANFGVKQYNIYNGDTLIGTTQNTNYLVSNISTPSIYRFTVKAVDTNNNISSASNISVIDFSDITPPTTPMNFSYKDVKLSGVTLTWSPSTDSSGISKYIIRDQSTNKEYISTGTSYTINNLNSASTYSYSVSAVDALGNKSHSSSILQVTTDGYINKNLEVKVDGLSTNEGVYNARTYRNGKTYVNISGLSGDVNGIVEGIDYLREGMDNWYSTNYLSQRVNVTETSDKVLLTPKPVTSMKTFQLSSVSENVYDFSSSSSVSENVYGLRSISNHDYDGMIEEVYDYLYTHPTNENEINEFFKSLRARINNNLKITEEPALQISSFSATGTTADSGYEPGPSNSQELALEKENSLKALWSMANGYLALISAENLFDTSELSNGNGDAFRHAYWGALMVADPDVGYNWAGRWGTAHEEGEPNNPADQKLMDLYNNFAGRSIGLLYTTKFNGQKLPDSWMQDLKLEVLLALENGELKRIDNEPVFTSPSQVTTFNSLSAISPMGATINPYDNIEMSEKHMKTDTTGRITSTQPAPAGLAHIKTYLSINRFKNGWGQVQYVGHNQLTIRAWINDQYKGRTYQDITVPMEMALYKGGYFATPQSIKAALAKYFEKKMTNGVYVRQWGAESTGIIYKVDGMSQFNVFGGNRSGSWVDINTFINSMGPLWETEYLAYTNSDALRDLQKSLDLISVFPVVGVVAGSGSIIISFVSGNTKDAALAAGFTAAGPVIGKFANYGGSAILRVYNSTKVTTILQKAGSSISNLKSAIKNTSSDLNSLITNVYSGYNGRIELEYADIGRMNFNQAQLIEGTNEVAEAKYKNFLETKWAETTPEINTAFEDAMVGEHFKKSGRIKVLKENAYYRKNQYTYTTDHMGRINKVEGDLVLKTANRNEYAQGIAGRQDRIRDLNDPDAGGHLIASSFNGSGELDNLVAMNAQINGSGGKWYEMEEVWRKALNDHYSVNVKIEPVYSGVSQRPSSFIVKYRIGDDEPILLTIYNKVGG
ncbi:hypothetical protein GC101_22180 [Paenibacillus sp. LMG 31459]|uniref:Fibronectin type-III domain-containing protein n=1 Tax=Paenibacillus phytohabitans TaxID=2654978 RepID=A0ABX1YPK0_9BACL|nr:DNA/RNA non-specific endonuclease [Paenibacillus phytohabitans]NOU81574.1 hypothetical protein [Paenibacillus phytohabitans]